MDYKKMMEEIKSELEARERFLLSFPKEIDDLIIRYLIANPHLLEDDAHRFLLDHALTELSRQNLRIMGREITNENLEMERGYLILFAQNASEDEKKGNELFAPLVGWLFELLRCYKAQLREPRPRPKPLGKNIF